MNEFLALIFVLLFFYILVKGAILTFKRQPVVAILCIIFILPAWFIWAIVEGIFG
jgi:hypothetical protein